MTSLYNPVIRRVIAHKIGKNMMKELATSVSGVTLIHSDMGSQYTNDLFERTIKNNHIKHSYSHKGCPGDNARMERFHSILKRVKPFKHLKR